MDHHFSKNRTCGKSQFNIFSFFKLTSIDKIKNKTHTSAYIKKLTKAMIELKSIVNIFTENNKKLPDVKYILLDAM